MLDTEQLRAAFDAGHKSALTPDGSTKTPIEREDFGLRAVESLVRADALETALEGAVMMFGDSGVTVYDSREHYDKGTPRPLPIRLWLNNKAAAIRATAYGEVGNE